MVFEELRSRYGTALAVQIMEVLPPQTFDALEMEDVAATLRARAEQAYRAYCDHLDNTPIQVAERDKLVETLNLLRRKWQEAEELAYYILDTDLKASQGSPRILRGA